MALANLGSISTRILTQLGSTVPASISGAELNNIVYDRIIYIQQYTGESIGSTNIAERYQPAILALSIAATLQTADAQQGNYGSYSLSEFSVSRSFGDNSLSAMYLKAGMEELRRLGRHVGVYKAFG